MNHQSLFDVFDREDASSEESDNNEIIENTLDDNGDINNKPPKRVSSPTIMHEVQSTKLPRLQDEPKPILADTFETQAETEFPEAKVDAETGTARGQQKTVKLAHQV